jgi:hypothetical protein
MIAIEKSVFVLEIGLFFGESTNLFLFGQKIRWDSNSESRDSIQHYYKMIKIEINNLVQAH